MSAVFPRAARRFLRHAKHREGVCGETGEGVRRARAAMMRERRWTRCGRPGLCAIGDGREAGGGWWVGEWCRGCGGCYGCLVRAGLEGLAWTANPPRPQRRRVEGRSSAPWRHAPPHSRLDEAAAAARATTAHHNTTEPHDSVRSLRQAGELFPWADTCRAASLHREPQEHRTLSDSPHHKHHKHKL